jgi:dUTP pyrophosphatase
MNDVICVKYKKLDHRASVPVYATEGSAGADLRSIFDYIIRPGETIGVNTGLAIKLPEGYEAQVRSRSGMALNTSISVLNSPGTIDSDFIGEIKVILHNHSEHVFEINRGDRIAQIVISPVFQAGFTEVVELSDTDRGSGGFGSTGNS